LESDAAALLPEIAGRTPYSIALGAERVQESGNFMVFFVIEIRDLRKSTVQISSECYICRLSPFGPSPTLD
jgi:hypothetical protein